MTAGPPHRAGCFRLVVLFSATALCSFLAPQGAAGQQRCRYSVDPERGYSQSTQTASGDFVHYLSGGIDYQCPDGARILADSAAIFQGENLAQLFGNVRFSDPGTELVASRADYYANSRQLQAWDQVRLFDRINGAVITGEELVLYRASPSRPTDRMIISGGAPHATVYLTDGGVESVVPYEVDADRFTLEGRRFFRAGGDVVVDRATLHAVGDSLDFDQTLGVMSVFENARVQDASFDLTARTVTVLTPEGTVEEVLARGEAELVGDGVFLEAPAVRMFVQQNQVERLVALGWIPPVPDSAVLAARDDADAPPPDSAVAADADAPPLPLDADPPNDAGEKLLPRPSAITEDFHLWADSIDVRSPGQVLDRVIAVGTARGQSISPADSAVDESLPDVAREDWMEGDTIVVEFTLPDSSGLVPADSTGAGVELRSITSIGSARSLYKVPPADSVEASPDAKPALHYVTADRIRIHLQDGEVTRMEVDGQTSGFHFEPTRSTIPDTAATSTAGRGSRPAREGLARDTLQVRSGGPSSPAHRPRRTSSPTPSRRER